MTQDVQAGSTGRPQPEVETISLILQFRVSPASRLPSTFLFRVCDNGDMSERQIQRSWLATSGIAAMLLLVPYATGYLLLAPDTSSSLRLVYRQFSRRWIALAYVPMGFIEAKARGVAVDFVFDSESVSEPESFSIIVFDPEVIG